MTTKIIAADKALPTYYRDTADIIPLIEHWLHGQEDRFIRKVIKIFEQAGVGRRFSIMDPEQVFTPMSVAQRNQIYMDAAIQLGKKCLAESLESVQWKPEDIDVLITVSCTGIMIPSLDAYLINELGMRQDVIRLPVTEMGCAAGVSAMIYAKHLLSASQGRRAAVIAFESPTATLQLDDYSMANMVSAAIFGDGAACVLLSSHEEDEGPAIVGEGMYHFYGGTHLMGFDWVDTGLKMVLDPEVPTVIDAHFDAILEHFLQSMGYQLGDINHMLFHPGGKKIMQAVEDRLLPYGKHISYTKQVLKEYGNMSSVTVLYVLEELLRSGIAQTGDLGLMLSFGPGFSAHRVLLRWE